MANDFFSKEELQYIRSSLDAALTRAHEVLKGLPKDFQKTEEYALLEESFRKRERLQAKVERLLAG